ncbi:MAG: hypothetical protein ACE5H4_15180, partial [Candidatus Thorarchaeota archaeon]
MRKKRMYRLLLVLLPLVVGAMLVYPYAPGFVQRESSGELVDLGNGGTVDVGPDEALYSYSLSDVPSSFEGVGSPLNVSEYGQRTDRFEDLELEYQTTNTTTDQTVSVPLGPLWEGTEMSVEVDDLQENRTWLVNPDFSSGASWTLGTDDVGTYTNTITSTITGGYVSFTMSGFDTGFWFRHDLGDRAYAEQAISPGRGEVTWVGVSLDYWVDDAWGGAPVGFWELYVQVGSADVPTNHLWDLQFSDVLAQTTWYSTGLIEADPTLVNATGTTIQLGMRTTRSFGCRPQLNPEVRLDNIRVFIKARVVPTQVNLNMNGLSVSNVSDAGWLWSIGTVTESALTPWQGSAVNATFSWIPEPVNPDPNIVIRVTFSVNVTVYARKLNRSTLYQAEVQSFGDQFSVSNASQV